MKTFYLIRHGQSEGNLGLIRQGPGTPLTEQGIQQAHFMAERCAKLPIEVLISSTMKRAYDTAEIIGQKIGKEVETSDLFVERRRPSEQIGVDIHAQKSKEIEEELIANFLVPGYHYSDEENFEDFLARAKEALVFLEKRPEKHIAVVMHGLFMRILLATALVGEGITPEICEVFMKGLEMENTGLTILRHATPNNVSTWRLWVWNDHAHLG